MEPPEHSLSAIWGVRDSGSHLNLLPGEVGLAPGEKP